jgi:prephenate dehydratase
MIPIATSIAGRVADVHHLVPEAGLYITREHFMPIRYHLMVPKGASLASLKRVRSHIQTIGQCRRTLRAMGLGAMTTADNAGAAREVAELGDLSEGALAPPLAAEIYGLDVLKRDVADAAHNTTRFLLFAPEPDDAEPDAGPCMTSFVFRVRNIPAALYKAMGGFATNGVNMTKLESYIEGAGFNVAMFYADVEGHPSDRNVRLALEELQFFSTQLKILGVYPADPWRKTVPG